MSVEKLIVIVFWIYSIGRAGIANWRVVALNPLEMWISEPVNLFKITSILKELELNKRRNEIID